MVLETTNALLRPVHLVFSVDFRHTIGAAVYGYYGLLTFLTRLRDALQCKRNWNSSESSEDSDDPIPGLETDESLLKTRIEQDNYSDHSQYQYYNSHSSNYRFKSRNCTIILRIATPLVTRHADWGMRYHKNDDVSLIGYQDNPLFNRARRQWIGFKELFDTELTEKELGIQVQDHDDVDLEDSGRVNTVLGAQSAIVGYKTDIVSKDMILTTTHYHGVNDNEEINQMIQKQWSSQSETEFDPDSHSNSDSQSDSSFSSHIRFFPELTIRQSDRPTAFYGSFSVNNSAAPYHDFRVTMDASVTVSRSLKDSRNLKDSVGATPRKQLQNSDLPFPLGSEIKSKINSNSNTSIRMSIPYRLVRSRVNGGETTYVNNGATTNLQSLSDSDHKEVLERYPLLTLARAYNHWGMNQKLQRKFFYANESDSDNIKPFFDLQSYFAPPAGLGISLSMPLAIHTLPPDQMLRHSQKYISNIVNFVRSWTDRGVWKEVQEEVREDEKVGKRVGEIILEKDSSDNSSDKLSQKEKLLKILGMTVEQFWQYAAELKSKESQNKKKGSSLKTNSDIDSKTVDYLASYIRRYFKPSDNDSELSNSTFSDRQPPPRSPYYDQTHLTRKYEDFLPQPHSHVMELLMQNQQEVSKADSDEQYELNNDPKYLRVASLVPILDQLQKGINTNSLNSDLNTTHTQNLNHNPHLTLTIDPHTIHIRFAQFCTSMGNSLPGYSLIAFPQSAARVARVGLKLKQAVNVTKVIGRRMRRVNWNLSQQRSQKTETQEQQQQAQGQGQKSKKQDSQSKNMKDSKVKNASVVTDSTMKKLKSQSKLQPPKSKSIDESNTVTDSHSDSDSNDSDDSDSITIPSYLDKKIKSCPYIYLRRSLIPEIGHVGDPYRSPGQSSDPVAGRLDIFSTNGYSGPGTSRSEYSPFGSKDPMNILLFQRSDAQFEDEERRKRRGNQGQVQNLIMDKNQNQDQNIQDQNQQNILEAGTANVKPSHSVGSIDESMSGKQRKAPVQVITINPYKNSNPSTNQQSQTQGQLKPTYNKLSQNRPRPSVEALRLGWRWRRWQNSLRETAPKEVLKQLIIDGSYVGAIEQLEQERHGDPEPGSTLLDSGLWPSVEEFQPWKPMPDNVRKMLQQYQYNQQRGYIDKENGYMDQQQLMQKIQDIKPKWQAKKEQEDDEWFRYMKDLRRDHLMKHPSGQCHSNNTEVSETSSSEPEQLPLFPNSYVSMSSCKKLGYTDIVLSSCWLLVKMSAFIREVARLIRAWRESKRRIMSELNGKNPQYSESEESDEDQEQCAVINLSLFRQHSQYNTGQFSWGVESFTRGFEKTLDIMANSDLYTDDEDYDSDDVTQKVDFDRTCKKLQAADQKSKKKSSTSKKVPIRFHIIRKTTIPTKESDTTTEQLLPPYDLNHIPSAQINLMMMNLAQQSPFLIAERGTHWSDVVVNNRLTNMRDQRKKWEKSIQKTKTETKSNESKDIITKPSTATSFYPQKSFAILDAETPTRVLTAMTCSHFSDSYNPQVNDDDTSSSSIYYGNYSNSCWKTNCVVIAGFCIDASQGLVKAIWKSELPPFQGKYYGEMVKDEDDLLNNSSSSSTLSKVIGAKPGMIIKPMFLSGR